MQIYVCRSGSAADTQAIASYVQYYLAQHQMELDAEVHVKTAATFAKQLCYSNKVLSVLPPGCMLHGIPCHAAVLAMPAFLCGARRVSMWLMPAAPSSTSKHSAWRRCIGPCTSNARRRRCKQGS